eukprot:766139-Hanusia_phi.AAC.5
MPSGEGGVGTGGIMRPRVTCTVWAEVRRISLPMRKTQSPSSPRSSSIDDELSDSVGSSESAYSRHVRTACLQLRRSVDLPKELHPPPSHPAPIM